MRRIFDTIVAVVIFILLLLIMLLCFCVIAGEPTEEITGLQCILYKAIAALVLYGEYRFVKWIMEG